MDFRYQEPASRDLYKEKRLSLESAKTGKNTGLPGQQSREVPRGPGVAEL